MARTVRLPGGLRNQPKNKSYGGGSRVNVRGAGRPRRLQYTEGGEVGRRRRGGLEGTPREQMSLQREHELKKARIGAAGQAVGAGLQRGLRLPGAERILTGEEAKKKPYVRRGARVSRELVRDVRIPGKDKYITRAESAQLGQRQRTRDVAARRAAGGGGRIQYQRTAGGPSIDQQAAIGGKYYGYKGEEGVPTAEVGKQRASDLGAALGEGQASRIRGGERFKAGLEAQRAAVAPYAGAQPTAQPGAATPTGAPTAEQAQAAAPMGDEQIVAELAKTDAALRTAEAAPGTATTAGQAGFMGEYEKLLAYRSQLQGLQQSRRAQAEAAHAQEMAAIPGRPSAQLSPLPSDTARTWADPRIEDYDRNLRAAQQQLGAEQARAGQIPQIAAAEAERRYPVRPPAAAAPPAVAPAAPDITAGITGRALPRTGGEGFGELTQLPRTPEEEAIELARKGQSMQIDTAQDAANLEGVPGVSPYGTLPAYTYPTLIQDKDAAAQSLEAIRGKFARPPTGQTAQSVAATIAKQPWYTALPTSIANLRRHQSIAVFPGGDAIGQTIAAYQALYDAVQQTLGAGGPTGPQSPSLPGPRPIATPSPARQLPRGGTGGGGGF